VGSNPDGVAYDSGKGEVFVANAGDSTVSVVSDSQNNVIATVGAGGSPMALAYDSGKGEVFVPGYGSGMVSVISDVSLGSGTSTSSSAAPSSTTSSSPPSTGTTTSGTTASSTASSSSSGSSLAISWSYLGVVAINVALLLALSGLAVARKRNYRNL